MGAFFATSGARNANCSNGATLAGLFREPGIRPRQLVACIWPALISKPRREKFLPALLKQGAPGLP